MNKEASYIKNETKKRKVDLVGDEVQVVVYI